VRQLVKRALELDSAFAPAWALLVISHRSRYDATDGRGELWLDSARQALDRALALAPDHFQVQNALGVVLRAESDTAGALEAYLRSAQLNPNYAPVAMNISTLYGGLGEEEQGNRWEARVRILRPDWPLFKGLQGWEAWTDGRYEDAERLYLEALQLDPNRFNTLLRLAELYVTVHR
jgi:tetratricopeptide (TPR) repeat protein